MKFLTLIVKFLTICLIGLIWPIRILAVGEFGTSYDVVYAIAPSGNTIVTSQVTLTNKSTNTYPKNFSIVLDTLNVKNVIAYDEGGVIVPVVSQKDSKTHILINFNQTVVGLGKQLPFTLRYETPDVAKKIGSVWEVTIPGILSNPDVEEYWVSFDVPKTFGPNIYLNPKPDNGKRYNKAQMLTGGISAAYGLSQNIQLNITYRLTNDTSQPTFQEVAIPPDTAMQRVTLKNIDPPPNGILVDQDGNWLAKYSVPADSEIDIEVELVAELFFRPRQDYSDPAPDEKYLSADEFWETDNAEILKIAQSHKSAREIYDYVVNTLAYDYDRISNTPKRQGAIRAISSPKSALCMEFTDLFITIARAAGIPARRVVGYAHTSNAKLRPLSLASDILHAWPEYYNSEKQLWIPVDPTWADTTGGVNYFDQLDLNHVAFAINGQDSSYPLAAGMYKGNDQLAKDIRVKFVDAGADIIVKNELKTEILFPQVIPGGITTDGKVMVRNTGRSSTDNIDVYISVEPLGQETRKFLRKLPPYGLVEVPIRIKIGHMLSIASGNITVGVNGANSYWQYAVRPLPWLFFAIIVIPVSGIVAFIVMIWRKKLWSKFRNR